MPSSPDRCPTGRDSSSSYWSHCRVSTIHPAYCGPPGSQMSSCHQVFKTNHHLRRHMDIHKGSGYPCNKCHKSLSSRKMLRQHEAACKQRCKHTCGTCGREYSSVQILKQHKKVSHGAGRPLQDEVFVCPYCQKAYNVEKSMREHASTCAQNPTRKGPYFC